MAVQKPSTQTEYAQTVRTVLQDVRHTAKDRLEKARSTMRLRHDNQKWKPFVVGQAVYQLFTLGKRLRFIVRFQFMGSSLEKLVSNLPVGSLKYTKEEFGHNSTLMARKGTYPYDYMNKTSLTRRISLVY